MPQSVPDFLHVLSVSHGACWHALPFFWCLFFFFFLNFILAYHDCEPAPKKEGAGAVKHLNELEPNYKFTALIEEK